jgi:hypothetical protein
MEPSNSDIFNLLVNMRGDMGRIEGTVKGFGDKLAEHGIDNKLRDASVQQLQLSQARQRGFVAAISTMGAVVGAGIGAAVDYLSRGNH